MREEEKINDDDDDDDDVFGKPVLIVDTKQGNKSCKSQLLEVDQLAIYKVWKTGIHNYQRQIHVHVVAGRRI